MSSAAADRDASCEPSSLPALAWLPLLGVCVTVATVHTLTNGRYGFHRDELQFLDDGRHLAWGFVAYPPLAPLIGRVAMALFGASLVGLRTFALLAQLGVVVVTAMLAREFGGRWFAQTAAALVVAATPLFMFEAHSFQYTGFDLFWCVALAWCLARLVNTGNPRWWLAAGAAVGLGLMTRYTMAFYLAALAVGIVLTPLRRYLAGRWLWAGAGLAFVIFLPNLIWQYQHGWITLHFLRFIHARDIGEGRAAGFWPDQLGIDMQDFAAPLALAGLAWFFLPAGRRFRALGWMFVTLVAVMALARGRGYYTGGVYPMLFAAGGAFWERGLQHLRSRPAVGVLQVATLAIVCAGGALTARMVLPWRPVGAPNNVALNVNGDLREEVGWPELVREVATIRDGLTPEQRASLAIVTNNYGETGAIDLYGPDYGLPPAISTVNSAWYRRYPAQPPQVIILLGSDRAGADRYFQSCRLAGRNANPWGIHNEESDSHPDIFLCGPLRMPWAQAWPRQPSFG